MFFVAQQVQVSGVPTWVAVLLAGLVPLAGAIGHKVGAFLVTTGKDFVEAKLKAAKHDELVPVVEALAHGVLEGSHEETLAHVQSKAVELGADEHPVIQRVLGGAA